MASGCEFGMKIETHGPDLWPSEQRGRELTVYIFTHAAEYGPEWRMDLSTEADPINILRFGPDDEQPASFWPGFIAEAERRLLLLGVKARPIADGDLKLGRFSSLRNEAFILGQQREGDGVVRSALLYPPNSAGWNAAGHTLPFPLPPLASVWRLLAWRPRLPGAMWDFGAGLLKGRLKGTGLWLCVAAGGVTALAVWTLLVPTR
eukprot:gnl/Hemi2/28063_TR9271_c0_g1_i1.p1 gnl/Hemi2/28063_TR9271_c0_g1~~gnl/Hemi2/28063_TR9271_c0_g1_i1.p1  ORF type:complete len:205 (+),score=55.30 gnl/Hemi2/28063_TR9271_c0_g1_i1:621-1235(+)